MESHLPLFFEFLILIALVLANGFFVAVEFAIVRSHPTKLREQAMKGRFGVSSGLKVIQELDFNLSATQLGITLASLLLGARSERALHPFFVEIFAPLGEKFAFFASHATATVAALTIVTFLHVVIGELAAKSLAIRFPETTLRLLAPFMLAFSRVCRPPIWIFNQSSNLFLRLFGVRGVAESERVHTMSELAMMVSYSTESGVIDKDEESMLKGVFGFSDTVAREVMTPRTDIVCISVSASFNEVLETIVQSGYSRFPVIGERIDEIKGTLLAKDLLPAIPKLVKQEGEGFDITKYLREPYYIPPTKPVDDLLNEFKLRKLHMAIVIDEHGGVDGIVTLEDLIEEIVGDIFDESDVDETDILIQEDGNVLVDGGVSVDDLNNYFDLEIPQGDYDTIAGFIITSLGRMPVEGDHIMINRYGNMLVNGDAEAELAATSDQGAIHEEQEMESDDSHALITVERVSNNRIERVRLNGSLILKPETELQAAAS